ncbi:MAG TPA: hypothetical protein VJ550_07635 [Geomonas sp.]|nr:hypothetical protein [Geomonas sp.]
MKTYHCTQSIRKEGTEPKGRGEGSPKVSVKKGSFDREAYEWNNALSLAAERMWR